jgi:GAF domain-containing protein/two-component sensor histidine kinase
MNDAQEGHLFGDPAYAELRESLLLLMNASDELILDHGHKLAETLSFILTQTRKILNADHVDIAFEYAGELRAEISEEAEIGRLIPIDQSICGLVLSTGKPILVNDLQDDRRLRDRYFPRVESDPEETPQRLSVLAAALTLDRQTIGVINVEATGTEYQQAHLEFVTRVAGHISMAITHAALFDEDAFRTATDKLLFESPPGGGDVAMQEVLKHILNALDSLAFVHMDAAEILFPDSQEGNSLTVAYSTNNADIGVRVDMESSVCGEAFRQGRTVVLQRAAERSDIYRPVFPDMRCELAIPIFYGGNDRFPLGVLNLESSRENAFSTVGQALAERFTRRVVNHVAMTKLRADIDTELQDQFRMLAADQWHNSVHRINNYVGSVRAIIRDLLEDLSEQEPPGKDHLIQQLGMALGDAETALKIPEDMRRRVGSPQESADVNEQVRSGIAAVPIPRHIELVTDLAAELPGVRCTALEFVVENLMTNAVKAMREPGQLRVSTWQDVRLPREPFVVVTVQDTGVGMTEEERARLFEPRQSGHQGGGLGFGMMWVRNWVRRAQGLIDVDSRPGMGTTVNIRFQIDPQQTGPTLEGVDPA